MASSPVDPVVVGQPAENEDDENGEEDAEKLKEELLKLSCRLRGTKLNWIYVVNLKRIFSCLNTVLQYVLFFVTFFEARPKTELGPHSIISLSLIFANKF